ncbi:uncharacterized protein LOC129221364 [Uloborus diversus]|uniref:uncharacterized protein LOC129221364 n=1 Tax=Uloborus diversus TaxID=327109 RepID=UPI002409B655|nr:uncharacterized protein LOC129221364 [Uloborus diversus]XP_054711810.1 uncharacterized protein LOC129221364 [Uloborus diversus]
MPQMVGPEKTLLIVKMCLAVVFLFGGAFGFFYFLYRNSYNASGWCLLTEIAAATILQFNAKYLRNQLHAKYSASVMQALKFLTGLAAVAGTVSGIVFIVLAVKDPFEHFTITSFYMAAITAFVSAVWMIILCLDCHKFERILLNPTISVIN